MATKDILLLSLVEDEVIQAVGPMATKDILLLSNINNMNNDK